MVPRDEDVNIKLLIAFTIITSLLSFSILYLRSTMPVTDASTANNMMMAMGRGGGRGILLADCQPSELCFE